MTVIISQLLLCSFVVATCVFATDSLPAAGLFFELEGISLSEAMIWVVLPLFAGIILGQAFRYTYARKTAPSLKSIIKGVRNSKHTILSILISPIVFFLVFQASKTSLETVQTLAFSFQNGFFINHLMAAILARGEAEFS